jgi:prophage antirepressor-like protein
VMNTSLAHFNGHNLSITHHAGRKWITSEQAGLALGYASDHARKSINTLYERHLDEFTEADSVGIKLMSTDGKAYVKRIFSETGCNKLGFFANTTLAKQFRQFASKALASETVAASAQLEARVQDLEAQLLAFKRAEFERRPRWLAIADMRQAGRSNRQIAQGLGIGLSTLKEEITRIRRTGFAQLLPAAPLAVAHLAAASYGLAQTGGAA